MKLLLILFFFIFLLIHLFLIDWFLLLIHLFLFQIAYQNINYIHYAKFKFIQSSIKD